mmetsp:Transcript_7106/g.20630  ORF Transcript_7106/g.20630 Transcript_7106/m.20630 type:complete len:739 (+) Transcript_7106:345-2561(+)
MMFNKSLSEKPSSSSKQATVSMNEVATGEEVELLSVAPKSMEEIHTENNDRNDRSDISDISDGNYDMKNSNSVPQLIIPPSPYCTKIAQTLVRGLEMKESSISRVKHEHVGHTRDVSLETTSSHSMNLSCLFKNHLDEQELDDKKGPAISTQETLSRSSGRPHSISSSLSLGVSQVVVLLSGGTENSSLVDIGISNDSASNNKNNETTRNKVNTSAVLPEPSSTPSTMANDDSVCPMSTDLNNSCYDRFAMVQVGEQIYRESLNANTEAEMTAVTDAKLEKEILQAKPLAVSTDATVQVSREAISKYVTARKVIFLVIGAVVAIGFGMGLYLLKDSQFQIVNPVNDRNKGKQIVSSIISKAEITDIIADDVPLMNNIESEVQTQKATPVDRLGGGEELVVSGIEPNAKITDVAHYRIDEEQVVSSIESDTQIEDEGNTGDEDTMEFSVGFDTETKHFGGGNGDTAEVGSNTSDLAVTGSRHSDFIPHHHNSAFDYVAREEVSSIEWDAQIKHKGSTCDEESIVFRNEFDPQNKCMGAGNDGTTKVGSNASDLDAIGSHPSECTSHNCNSNPVFNFGVWPVGLLILMVGFCIWLRAGWDSALSVPQTKVTGMAKKLSITPTKSSSSQRKGTFLTPPPSSNSRSVEPTEWMSPCYGENALDISVYESMTANELQKLLRSRRLNYQEKKEQMIKRLVHSYQSELACLTVRQLRPKLRKRKLSQKGSKKDIIRRLVEADPPR